MTAYDVAIVGGGIVGLATAREVLRRAPGLKVIVIEKESGLAQHQTGHNSGVLHTGIYYAPGSLKARTCVAGRAAMVEYCQEKGIPFKLSGKLIVALNEKELPRLQTLYERGTANNVPGLEMVGPERIKEIEPYAVGIKAIWSPNTGVVNYKQVAEAYAGDVKAAGGEIITHWKLIGLAGGGKGREAALKLQKMPLDGPHEEKELTARYVITCGGLHSDIIARLTGAGKDVKIVPFRGDYYLLRPEKRQMVRSMIYPVPDPQFPFLGVHFTRLMNGEVKAGPNAVLAFAREGYGRKDINLRELWESIMYPGFIRLAVRYWRMGLMEMYRDYVKPAYVRALQRYMPEITGDDLLPGPSGVRAQALMVNGKLVDDFLIYHGENVTHVQNAPSPAATSSLMIAQTIIDEVTQRFEMRPQASISMAMN
jgi:L-2-hydroxyglutarate oxidase LhgO